MNNYAVFSVPIDIEFTRSNASVELLTKVEDLYKAISSLCDVAKPKVSAVRVYALTEKRQYCDITFGDADNDLLLYHAWRNPVSHMWKEEFYNGFGIPLQIQQK